MKIIPGIVSVTFRQLPAEDMIDLCIEAGLKAVEWSENCHVMPGDPKGATQLKKQTEKAGLLIAAYGSYYRLGNQTDQGEIFLQSLMSAKALEAPIIRVWAGGKPSEEVTEEEFLSMAYEASMIAELAEKEGIKVAFEWHKDTLTDTNESAMKLLHQANHPNLYCLWQPTVALSMEQRKKGLDLLGERMLNLHIYYWESEGESGCEKRKPLEEGRQVWMEYLKHVDNTRQHFGLLEFVMGDTKEQLLADARALCQLLEEVGRG